MAQLNITLNQEKILQLLSTDHDQAFRELLRNSLIKSSTNKAEYWGIGKDYVAETHEIPYNDAG